MEEELPYDYIGLLDLESVETNTSYLCSVSNDLGNDTTQVTIAVQKGKISYACKWSNIFERSLNYKKNHNMISVTASSKNVFYFVAPIPDFIAYLFYFLFTFLTQPPPLSIFNFITNY